MRIARSWHPWFYNEEEMLVEEEQQIQPQPALDVAQVNQVVVVPATLDLMRGVGR